MLERLLRTQEVLGNDAINSLSKATVLIAGLGGVGGYTLEALARSGIMNFILVDSDKFETSNLNRQILATTETIGKAKTEVAKQRILQIDSNINVTTKTMFIDETNIDELLDLKPTLVVDAIDSVNSKCLLLANCKKKEIKVVSSMGAALRKDPTQIKIDDISKTYGCPLAKQVRTKLKEYQIYDGIPCVFSPEQKIQTQDQTLGSLPTVVGCFGLTLAQLAIDQII